MPTKNVPHVVWLIPARQQLKAALARPLASAPDLVPLTKKMKWLDDVLRRTFSDAETIVVRERLHGFRIKTELHSLWIEWFAPSNNAAGECHSCIAKIADDTAVLKSELDGWRLCCPPGMDSDTILTNFQPGPLNKKGEPISLLYAEGHSVLATGDACDFEQACKDACQFGTPTIESLILGLKRLFVLLHRRFYQQSFVVEPSEAFAIPAQLDRRIGVGLEKWADHLPGADDVDNKARARSAKSPSAPALSDEERLEHRRKVLAYLADQRDSFLDPCDMMRHQRDNKQGSRLLCGCSHGDLHGRNILVSPVHNEGGSLCLYDFEDMRPNNAIGWDFVKLETELKIRIYPLLFPNRPMADFARQVHQFEVDLAVRSEAMYDNAGDESRGLPAADDFGQRMVRLLLAIRREAMRYLGEIPARHCDWLDEYYFLLAAYGCTMAKVPTYGQRELMAGYIAAGVAARRLHTPWKSFDHLLSAARAQGQQAAGELKQLAGEPPDRVQAAVEQQFDEAKSDWLSYHEPLEYVRQWSRAGRQETGLLRAAVCFLNRLREQYPHALEIEEELTFTLLELGETDEAEQVIREVEQRYPREVLVEMLCRRGRMAKNEVELRIEQNGLSDSLAQEQLQKSLGWYRSAYESGRTYYPAVNVVSLTYLLNGSDGEATKEALDTAVTALEAVGEISDKDRMWFDATWGEVRFLEGKHDEAEVRYRHAVDHRSCNAHARQTMLRQLRLLLRVPNDPACNFWTAGKLVSVFGAETYAAVFGPADASCNNEERSQ